MATSKGIARAVAALTEHQRKLIADAAAARAEHVATEQARRDAR